MNALFQAFREWQARQTYRNAVRFFDRMRADARRLHAPTKHIEQAQREWLHRALGRKVAP